MGEPTRLIVVFLTDCLFDRIGGGWLCFQEAGSDLKVELFIAVESSNRFRQAKLAETLGQVRRRYTGTLLGRRDSRGDGDICRGSSLFVCFGKPASNRRK